MGLNASEADWLVNVATDRQYREICMFYETSNGSEEAVNFANLAINTWINSGEVDIEGGYIQANTPEDNYIYQGTKQYIPNPLVLTNGDQITVTFISNTSDQVSSNQKIAVDVIDGMKFALQQANSNLTINEKITSINIYCTTNGKHSTSSNHYSATAVDISRINGNKMSVTGVTNQIIELQKAMDNYPNVRENFGPYFKHKTYLDGTRDNSYSVPGHKDHIHFSTRQ